MLIPLGMAEWCIPFWVNFTLTLTSGLISRFSCLEHISYITAYFPGMCLMLDQFLWGHSSCDCDISCFVNVELSPMLITVLKDWNQNCMDKTLRHDEDLIRFW